MFWLPVSSQRAGQHATVYCILLSGCLILSIGQSRAGDTGHQVEVFVAGAYAVSPPSALEQSPAISDLRIYRLDGIQQVEQRLSENLPVDPQSARRIVLGRVQQLDPSAKSQMQRSAVGLARAMRYGIDRYPAIVFDEKTVIYGVIDLAEAMRRYRHWLKSGGS